MNKETTIVAIGCSTDRDYNFLLPLTCLFWREVIGYEPFVMIVGHKRTASGLEQGLAWVTDPRAAVVLRALKAHNMNVLSIGCPLKDTATDFSDDASFYPMHTTAQNCRQHAAACAEIDDAAWVMPADADLWPLRREFYHQHEGTQHKAVCYYANGDHFQNKHDVLERAAQGLGSQTIPTCHVAMRARDWRTIYGLIPGDVSGSIKKSLDAWLPGRQGRAADFTLWMSDQQLMTEALCQQMWFPSMALMVERRGHPPVDRLCRSVPSLWQEPFDPSKWVDAHVHKSPDSEEHWRQELPIIEALLPQHAKWARAYREEYVAAGG